jgi:crotonobetainyl-CoA:carnitine CoA-transferase CaiB-like acyl-CoA transferase
MSAPPSNAPAANTPASSAPQGPLAGVRVLDFGMNIAGPYAASVLADFGAEVIKVESPEGDAARAFEPMSGGISALFAAMNHRRRYLGIDLKQPQARPVIERLIARADVLIQNLRQGRAEKLGIDAAACHARNPRLVHASIEAFYPHEGERPGYDLMVQAESGMMAMTGHAGGPPARTPSAAIDHVTGLWTATAVLAAMAGPRDRAVIKISMLDVALGLLNDRVANYLVDGQEPLRMGSATTLTTAHQAYPTADGHILIGAPSDGFFAKLSKVLGPPVEGDARFDSQSGRLALRAELDAAICSVLARDGTQAWYDQLNAAGIPVAVVRPLSAAVARHAQYSATGLTALSPAGLRMLAPPVQMAGVTAATEAPRQIGADTDAVLAEYGFSEGERVQLREAGIIV